MQSVYIPSKCTYTFLNNSCPHLLWFGQFCFCKFGDAQLFCQLGDKYCVVTAVVAIPFLTFTSFNTKPNQHTHQSPAQFHKSTPWHTIPISIWTIGTIMSDQMESFVWSSFCVLTHLPIISSFQALTNSTPFF